MERSILFISKYPDIVEEFLSAMKGKDFSVDTASDGEEAWAKLSGKVYHVIVTGLVLDGYNGEQIVTRINETSPDTVCIIYTTTISAAQLHFFMNKRDVFRVFLRPVDFQTEFFQALEEAFLYHEVRLMNWEEETEKKQALEQGKRDMAVLSHRLEFLKRQRKAMQPYMKRLAALTLEEYAGRLNAQGKSRLNALEGEVAELCLADGGRQKENLVKAQAAVRKIAELAGR